MPDSNVFAINFGMARSWAAVVHNGMGVIEPSARGIPSYVEFGKLAPRVCGKFTESVNAANSIYAVKRLLGHKFDDPIDQDAAKYSPMDIVRGEEGRPAVLVEYYGESRPVLLEEVAAMIMVELKERIEKVVGHPTTDVVLTVSHCFGDSQRRALRDAATIAGLNVVRLLNETTAAVITYSQRCEQNDSEQVLVVDVGGGSVNVAVVEVTASSVGVKSTAGSCCLGAEEFDRTLTDYCLDELAQNNGIDVDKLGVRSRKRLQRQFKSQCVEARQTLYSSTTARIKLDINGAEVQLDVSREAFDAFNEANFDRIRALIKAAIDDAPTDGALINAVYLIGGGSRVIALEKAITSLLPGTRLVKTFYRDEAVIKGAAVFASHFGSDGAGFKLSEILGRSVLLETNKLQEIFAHDATVPCEFSIAIDRNAPKMNLKVSEYTNGSSHPVGTFVIGDVPGHKLTRGQVNCTFRIDENGLLSMSATQEAAHSQGCFSKASFRVQLPSTTRRFLYQSIAISENDGTMVPIIDASRYDIALPASDGKVFLQHDGSQSEMQFSNARLRTTTFNRLIRKRADVLDKLAQDGLLASEVYAKYKQELEALCSAADINGGHSNGGSAGVVDGPQGAGSSSGAIIRSSSQKSAGSILGSIVSKFLP